MIDSKTIPYDQNYTNGVEGPGGPNYEILPETEEASNRIDKASQTAQDVVSNPSQDDPYEFTLARLNRPPEVFKGHPQPLKTWNR